LGILAVGQDVGLGILLKTSLFPTGFLKVFMGLALF